MIRKFLLLMAFTLVSIAGINAQVTNYSLKLDAQGSVNCGSLAKLYGKTSYTVQFWMNPTTWTEGATIYSQGDGFKAELGSANSVVFTVGTTTLTATSSSLTAGAWNQLTLVSDNGTASVLVNGTSVATGALTAVPSDESDFVIGGGTYSGRIDEMRLWAAALSSDYNYFINNTLNIWCPQWDDLAAYYKFDQDLCENIVDYKSVYETDASYNNHGVMSSTGAAREEVTDNTGLPYLINGAYTANERFYDRAIPRWQYLFSNDLIILGIESQSDGHLKLKTPNNHGTITNGTYLAEYQGRTGVLSLNGDGYITAPSTTLDPVIDSSTGATSLGYTFETWIYLEEWTEGAYIFKKETADGANGFSISLGADSTKQVVISCNGYKFRYANYMTVGEWVHLAVTTNQGAYAYNTYSLIINGVAKSTRGSLCDGSTDYTPTGVDDCEAIFGQGIKGKLDETVIWNKKYTTSDIANHMNSLPMPGLGVTQTTDNMRRGNTYYTFDDPDNLGYSSYSQDEWKSIMEAAYEGYRGYQIRISVASHTGWQTTISDESKRKIFAADLAELAKGYDGVELDLEWMDTSSAWQTYGLLADEIRAALPEDQTFFISCHGYGAYQFPTSKMDEIDGFTFQQYGPNRTHFYFSTYKSQINNFLNYGFPSNKIMTSYATTTSGAYYEGGSQYNSTISGVRSGFLQADDYVPSDADYERGLGSNGYYYYFTGPIQVYNRAKYCVDNGLQGIFYWDMGNDIPVTHDYNLAKNCSFGLNANVDTLITKVDVNHYAGITNVVANKNVTTVVIAPNPVKETMSVALANGAAATEVKVFDLKGACLMDDELVDGSVDVSGIAPGMYAVVIKDDDGNQYNAKFIKK